MSKSITFEPIFTIDLKESEQSRKEMRDFLDKASKNAFYILKDNKGNHHYLGLDLNPIDNPIKEK